MTHREITFESLNDTDQVSVGQPIQVNMKTTGLSSFYRLRSARLYLLDEDLNLVIPEPLVEEKEFKVLQNVHRNKMFLPVDGEAQIQISLPESLPLGKYHLKYVRSRTHSDRLHVLTSRARRAPGHCGSVKVNLIK